MALSSVRIHHDFMSLLLFLKNLSIANDTHPAINGLRAGLNVVPNVAPKVFPNARFHVLKWHLWVNFV